MTFELSLVRGAREQVVCVTSTLSGTYDLSFVFHKGQMDQTMTRKMTHFSFTGWQIATKQPCPPTGPA